MNRSFSIIANNCWGAEVYKYYNLPFNTPTIGLYFYPACFIKFSQNLDHYIDHTLEFAKHSKHFSNSVDYPIGVIDDIEVHFLHYKTEEEALSKWTRRCKRIPKDSSQRFFKFDDRDGATLKQVNAFLSLELPNSLTITKHRINDKNHLWMPMPRSEKSVMDGYTLFYESIKYFDLDTWIRGNGIKQSGVHKLRLLLRRLKVSVS